jgi:HlyD family secretion protein
MGWTMKKKRLLIIPLTLIAAALAYQYLLSTRHRDTSTISVSGNIEVTDAEVSFKISGRVLERLVSEGHIVKAGQVVARLDSEDLRHEVALRRAQVQAARAFLAELEAGSRPEEIREAEASYRKARAMLDELLNGSRPQEVAAAQAALKRAKAEAERWKAEDARLRKLYREKVVSTREFEAVSATYQTAHEKMQEAEERLKLVIEGPRKEQIEQARSALNQAKARLDLIRKGPRQETKDRARAELQQARESLALAETRLNYATIVSPLTGVVLSENIEPGEYVSPGTPIVTVGDLLNVWLRAYINETDLGRVKVGQKVRVTTDTYPGKTYNGQVSFIASEAEFTPKNVQTQKERVKLVYRIKIDISNPKMELKPGMPADGEILLSEDPS